MLLVRFSKISIKEFYFAELLLLFDLNIADPFSIISTLFESSNISCKSSLSIDFFAVKFSNLPIDSESLFNSSVEISLITEFRIEERLASTEESSISTAVFLSFKSHICLISSIDDLSFSSILSFTSSKNLSLVFGLKLIFESLMSMLTVK